MANISLFSSLSPTTSDRRSGLYGPVNRLLVVEMTKKMNKEMGFRRLHLSLSYIFFTVTDQLIAAAYAVIDDQSVTKKI